MNKLDKYTCPRKRGQRKSRPESIWNSKKEIGWKRTGSYQDIIKSLILFTLDKMKGRHHVVPFLLAAFLTYQNLNDYKKPS